MQEDRFTELALKALWCKDEQLVRPSSLAESEELSTAQMKMAGLIPVTDEERLRLMQEVDKIPLEKAKELLATFKARGR